MPLPKDVQEKRRRMNIDYFAFWNISNPDLIEYQNYGHFIYKGKNVDDQGLGTPAQIRTCETLDVTDPLAMNQFEVRLLNTGLSNTITVGVCDKLYPTDHLPGWEAPTGTAIGVDTAEGLLYYNTDEGKPEYKVCRVGDVIKCVLVHTSLKDKVNVEFYYNGKKITQVFVNVPKSGGFYGVIGLASTGEEIVIGPPERVEVELFESLFDIKSHYITHKGSGVCAYVSPKSPTYEHKPDEAPPMFIGTLRSLNPVKVSDILEVQLVNSGEENAIAVGVCGSDYPIDCMPGWREESIAYHADISSILNGSQDKEMVADWKMGDTLQCVVEGIDGSTKEVRVIFRKNGDIISKNKVWSPSGGFYWSVVMMSKDEEIQVMIPRRLVPLDTPKYRFEDVWQLPSPSVEYSRDGICVYVGQGGLDDLGIIRSREPINPLSPFPFFDVKIVNPGKMCQIAIGVCNKGYPSLAMPGWMPKSIGFHSDNGDIYQSSEFAKETTGHRCTQGDVIRCLVAPIDGSEKRVKISFFRNGNLLASALEWTPSGGFYALVGMMSDNEKVQVACPLMRPSTLKKGLEGLDSTLTKLMYGSHAHVQTAPVIIRKHPQPSDHVDYPEEYVYRPPASPFAQRSKSEILSTPDNEIQVDGPHSLPRKSAQTVQHYPSKGKRQSFPQDPRSQGKGSRKQLQYIEPLPPQIQLIEPPLEITEPPLEITVPEIDKKQNHNFRSLYNVICTELEELVTDNTLKTQYGYAICRHSMVEKMNYFEVDLLAVGSRGIAVGISSDKVSANVLLGTFPSSISLHASSGKLYNGSSIPIELGVTFKQGDTVGCKVEVVSRLSERPENKNLFSPPQVRVQFYKNAVEIAQVDMSLPITDLYPTICFLESNTRVKLNYKYKMKPLDYFETRPIPEGHFNFPYPNEAPTPTGWKCQQKCELTSEGNKTSVTIAPNIIKNEKSVLIQHYLPFSKSDSYFEVELSAPSRSYSVVCIGAMSRLENDDTNIPVPGEKQGSIGFMPLAGLITRNTEVASYVHDAIVEQANVSQGGLKLGIGLEEVLSTHETTDTAAAQSMLFFFTLNNQEIGKLICPVTPAGLYPTLAILLKPLQVPTIDSTACHLVFPQQWPCCDLSYAPWGFARISPGFKTFGSTFVCDTSSLDSPNVNGLQASYPLSPKRPYYEITVISGGTNYQISIGVAPLLHPLHIHVGMRKPSIGYHINQGCIFHDNIIVASSPIHNYKSVTVGCGAIYPEDGSRGSAEVFFTVNGILMSRHFMLVPAGGFFPTICTNTGGGMVSIDLNCPQPFPDMKFSTQWHVLENVLATGQMIQLISHAHIGIAQVAMIASIQKTTYYKVVLSSHVDSGKILMGFSNCTDSPFSPRVSGMNRSFFFELSTGTIILIQNGVRRSDECQVTKDTTEFGCGVQTLPNSHSILLFFTANNQMIYATTTTLLNIELRPTLCMVGSLSKVKVDTCSLWPPVSPVGFGWGRYSNVQYIGGCLTHQPTNASIKSNIGFVQSSSPLIPNHSYFEVEILKVDPKKAIAVGLGSKRYNMTHWLGWKSESIAYHTDDGRLFKSDGQGINTGPKLFEGDVIGCGIQFPMDAEYTTAIKGGGQVNVFFTVNGHFIGVFELMTVPEGGLFPTVCLESSTEMVCVHLQAQYPSSLSKMSRRWSRAYCTHQAGHIIEHSFQVKGQKVQKIPSAFCQSNDPLSLQHPYFEVEILRHGEGSHLAIGLAPLQPLNTPIITTGSILFNLLAHVSVIDDVGTRPVIVQTRQKFEVGDRIGCKLKIFQDSGKVSHVELCRNGIKVTSTPIPDCLMNIALFPIIVLTKPEDAVVPMLNAPPPSYTPRQHIGWLRSERVKQKGSVVEYSGLGVTAQRSVGVAQMNQPLNLRHPYYEIEVLDSGETCCIAIGAASIDHPMTNQPGWVVGSIGYHGDDGCIFNVSGTGCSFGPRWKQNDVVGLGVRPYEGDVVPGSEIQVFFTMNGQELGHTTAEVPDSGFFPTVGLHSKGEKIKVNHNSRQSNTSVKSYLRWRTLIGVSLEYSTLKQRDIIKFFECERRTPTSVQGQTPGLGLAMGYEPFSAKLQYFEVEILNLGELKAVAIGAACKGYSAESVPGWRQNSVAYHTDSGHLHHASGMGKKFGPLAHKGDVIGCGVVLADSNYRKYCSIFFTRNGVPIGYRVQAATPEHGFYPTVGLVSPGDKVAVRFMETFKPSPKSSDSIVGLMRIHNSSYSDHMLVFNGGTSTGPANAQFAIALNTTQNYYTANIVEIKDYIRIGLAPRDYPLSHAPGMSSYSVAYDVTAGTIRGVFGPNDIRGERAPKCQPGDIVGCGVLLAESDISSDSKKSTYYAFFTHNGMSIHQMELPEFYDDLFPIVGFLPEGKKSAVYMDWTVTSFEAQNIL